jgi:hypothetical protein
LRHLLYHEETVSVTPNLPRAWGLLANGIVLGLLASFAWLAAYDPDAYYRSVQEDQVVEWASFWSFLIAGLVFGMVAVRQRRSIGALPWFPMGLALFCFFVAMEEVSWGQRILGQRPPVYFLEKNYQQELNLHNIAGTWLRLFVFRAIVIGYGVLLPILVRIPEARRQLERLRIVPPPIPLVPSMLAMFCVHLWYPWKFTGEIIECLLGMGFLFAAIANASQLAPERNRRPIRWTIAFTFLIVALAFSTAWWSQNRKADDHANVAFAEAETQALARDLIEAANARHKQTITGCGLHKRIYTFVEGNQVARPLGKGGFAALISRGLPSARAEFYLDPWNSPYWIRDRCDEKTGLRSVFVYSYGPNRIRDSSRWEILHDDVGAYVLVEP